MWDEIMTLAFGSGIWSVLFCFLFLYQLKDSRAREQKYIATIDRLTEHLNKMDDIAKDCHDIKRKVELIVE